MDRIENNSQFIMEQYIPHKTPYKVFDNLKSLLTNKSVYEIGSRWGICLNYIKQHFNVSKVGGIDLFSDMVYYCKNKFNIDTTVGSIFELQQLPEFDVYYVWSSFTLEEYEKIINLRKGGTMLISFFIESPKCDGTGTCKHCGVQSKSIQILNELQTLYPSSYVIETKYSEGEEYTIHTCRTSGVFKTLVV